MTVAQLREKYTAIQREAAGIEAELKPLFKRLRSLSKRTQALGEKVYEDDNLFATLPEGMTYANGWNIDICACLRDSSFIDDGIEYIVDELYNLRHTPFRKKGEKR